MGVCVLQVTLAYESIVLYMCEGKVLMDSYCSRSSEFRLFQLVIIFFFFFLILTPNFYYSTIKFVHLPTF